MKKIFTFFYFLILLFAGLYVSGQSHYFHVYPASTEPSTIIDGEGFDSSATAISGSSMTPSNGSFVLPTGTWQIINAFRGGSGCTPILNSTGTGKAIRLIKANTATSTVFPAIITPLLSSGVNTVSWKNAKTNTGTLGTTSSVSVYRSTNGGNTWTVAQYVNTTATACGTYTVTINNPLVNMIKFQSDSAGTVGNGNHADQDIDNIDIVSTSVITPVTFNGISAVHTFGMNKISWNILTELNTSHYEIERSINGTNFLSIGTVSAINAGKYSFIDVAPNSGNNFYRINGVDKDGKMMYSTIVRVNAGKKLTELVITPNPVQSNMLNIQLSNAERGTYTMKLYNNVGALVVSNIITNEGGAFAKSIELPASVTKGIYQLQLVNGTTRLSKTVIVQ